MAPERITPTDVQTWITTSTLKPITRRQYVGTLRLILDHAEVEPNPARHRSIRFPRVEHEIVQPPSSSEVRTILGELPEHWRLPVRLLCATGVRVGELAHVTWGDVDIAESQFRIAKGKTKAARRWASVRADLMQQLLDLVPPDDRTPTTPVFPKMTEAGCRVAMWRACQRAGIANYSPHDLRHRWISVQLKRGVPITEVSATAGHSPGNTSMTLDVYAHVVTDTDDI